MVNMINAETYIVGDTWSDGAGTVGEYMYVEYTTAKSISSTFFGFIPYKVNHLNLIPDSSPYEFAFNYNSYIFDWNNNYLDKKVDYCTIDIYRNNLLNSTNIDVFTENYTSETDVNDQYFFRAFDGDTIYAYFLCHFNDSNYRTFNYPASVYVYTPTPYCQNCQYARSVSNKQSSQVVFNLNANIRVIQNYIYELILINYEIVLYLFWLFMIAILFFVVGMIFWSGYWLYFYLASVIK